jgi:hypothetical protein
LSALFYCLDNDIILKLATCNLFEDTLTSFEIDYSQVKIIETAKYKIRSLQKQTNKRQYRSSQYNLESALNITKSCSTISEQEVNQDLLKVLENIEGIDLGEAILISYVSYLNQQEKLSYLLTGDKRCLKALSQSNLTNFIKPLEGKFWCLEQLILKNIYAFGFEFVKKKVLPVNYCDTTLKVIFSSELTTEEHSKEALISYLNQLRKETNNLLNSYPN